MSVLKPSKIDAAAKSAASLSFLHKGLPAYYFSDLDKNKNGILSLNERPQGMVNTPESIMSRKEKIAAEIKAQDKDDSGYLENGWHGVLGYWWNKHDELADLQSAGYSFANIVKVPNDKWKYEVFDANISNKSYKATWPENSAFWQDGKVYDIQETIDANIQVRPLINLAEVPIGDYKEDGIYILTRPTERAMADDFHKIADDNLVTKGEKLKDYALGYAQRNQNRKLKEAGLLDETANRQFKEVTGIELPTKSIVEGSTDPNFVGYDPSVLGDTAYQVSRDTDRDGVIDETGKEAWNFYEFYNGLLSQKDAEYVEAAFEPPAPSHEAVTRNTSCRWSCGGGGYAM